MKQLNTSIIALILAALLPFTASAATRTWNGSGSANWSALLNWSGNTVPVDGDTVIFNAAWGNTTNDLTGVRIFNLTVAPGNDIYGNAVHLSALTCSGPASANSNIHADVTLNAEVILTASYGADNFRISGDLRLNGHSLTVVNSAGGDVILNGVIMGTGSLLKQGTSVLEIAGDTDNTFTGTVTVEKGTLRLNKVNGGVGQIAIPGDLFVGIGLPTATVQLDHARQIANTATVTVEKYGTLNLNGNSDTIGSLVLIESPLVTGVGTLTIANDIICPVNPGNLAPSNSITGNLAFDAGSFHVLELSTNVALAIFANVSGGGNLSHTGPANSTLQLTGTNTFTGTITNTSGVLAVGAAGLGDTNAPTVVNGGILFLLDDVLNEPLTLAAPGQLFAGNGTFKFSGNITTVGSPSFLSLPTGSQLTLSGSISGNGFNVGLGTVALAGNSDNTYTGTVSVVGGSLYLNKNTNNLAITGPLQVGSLFTSASGYVYLQRSGQFAATAPVTISDGLLDLNGSSTTLTNLTLSDLVTTGTGVLTLAGSLIAVRDAAVPTIEGIVSFGNRLCPLNITREGSVPDLDLRATLISTGSSGGFSKTNTGVLWLSGTNTYSGLTYISNGVVRCDSAFALGDATPTYVFETGSLYLNGVTLDEAVELSSSGGFGYAALDATNKAALTGTINLRGNSTAGAKTNSTLTLTNTFIASVAGVMLTKTNPGTLVFAGVSANVGRTLVSQGALLVNSTNLFGPITILGGAGLGGSGKVGTVTNLGAVFPGDYNSPTGAVFTAGDIISAGGKISFDLGTLGANNHDRLILASLTGTNTLEIFDRTNTMLANGSTQTIVTKLLGVANVPFLGLPENAAITSSNHNFLITYKGGGSNDVALTVAARNGAAGTLGTFKSLGAGVFQINATGTANSLYSLLTTTNVATVMTNWITVTNLIATGGGGIQLNRTNTVGELQRYYRLKSF